MVNNLKKLLSSQKYDGILELMLESTDSSVADAFIEDDGEAVIDEKQINDILAKIPEYDEEEALNKKLDRIAESYIPEELNYVKEESTVETKNDEEYVEEGFKELLGRLKRCFSEDGRVANSQEKHLNNVKKGMINSLNSENDINELRAYKKWLEECIEYEEKELDKITDKNIKDVREDYIAWIEKFVKKVERKINKLEKQPEKEK